MSKSAKEFLEAEVQRKVTEAKAITATAEKENRAPTDGEREKVEGLLAEATGYKTRLQEIEDNEKLQKSIEDLGIVMPTGSEEDAVAKTMGDAFIKSDQYRALKERGMAGRWTTGPIQISGVKAPGDPMLTTTGDNEQIFEPQRVPGIQGPVEQRLTVADLFGQGMATASSIKVIKETLTDNNAAVTLEGDPKPASELRFTSETVAVEKIATFLPVADEMLEDEPQMASYLNGRLTLFVRQAEEAYLVAKLLDEATGTGAAADIGGDNLFDAILAGITDARINGGLEPDAIVWHPLDAAQAKVRKAEGSGVYYSGGPYTGGASNPWGIREVITSAVPEGSPVVGAFREGGTVWRKGGLTVEASNSHDDYFVKNLTAIRAEERLALAIYRPAAFSIVTLGS